MKSMIVMTKRNIKLFFKDKGMFFTALVTPAILLVLYATFLGNIYRDSFLLALPTGMPIKIDGSIIDGLVGAQLVSSILAVSCVTVAFCANFLMVQDKANGTAKDFKISPISASSMSMSYYAATLISTLLICLAAAVICLIYMAFIGWFMSALDVLLLVLDIILLVLFGVALSSLISFFLSTQGQISAVGTVISAGYGFICGAYMPISSFNIGLQRVLMFLPGTYGTSLIRNHAMRGVLEEMESIGVPELVTEDIKKSLDCTLYFFDTRVSEGAMYLILAITTVLLIGAYILLNYIKRKRAK